MMQQARIQFGFQAENIPLMIEAIPLSSESIILIITKVEDPEELDTRFSKFSPFKGAGRKNEMLHFDGADTILDIFQKLKEARKAAESASGGSESPEEAEPPVNLLRMYSFDTLDRVIMASHGLNGACQGASLLYKDPLTGAYCLVIHQDSATPEDFNKICNILSEYGEGHPFTASSEAFLKEHGELVTSNALSVLSEL